MNVEGKQHVDTKHKLWSQNDYNEQRECERLRLIIIQLPLSSCYRKIPIFRFDFYSQSRIKSKKSCKNTIEPKHMTHILCGSSNFSATIDTRAHHSLSPVCWDWKEETTAYSGSIRLLMTMGWHYVVCCLVCEWWWCFCFYQTRKISLTRN